MKYDRNENGNVAGGKRPECGMKAGESIAVHDVKPCVKLEYCPYGALVEQFQLPNPHDKHGCDLFGHLCPVFVVAERRCDGNGSQCKMTATVQGSVAPANNNGLAGCQKQNRQEASQDE